MYSLVCDANAMEPWCSAQFWKSNQPSPASFPNSNHPSGKSSSQKSTKSPLNHSSVSLAASPKKSGI